MSETSSAFTYTVPAPITPDRDAFIKFFEAIPGDRWIVNDYVDDQGRCCAAGHLGARDHHNLYSAPASYHALSSLLGKGGKIGDINNGKDSGFGCKPDPEAKTRIIAALRALPAV